ncbi:hypothetical protein BC567DRAFT_281331 [Phyllosticta citribraziliensis]
MRSCTHTRTHACTYGDDTPSGGDARQTSHLTYLSQCVPAALLLFLAASGRGHGQTGLRRLDTGLGEIDAVPLAPRPGGGARDKPVVIHAAAGLSHASPLLPTSPEKSYAALVAQEMDDRGKGKANANANVGRRPSNCCVASLSVSDPAGPSLDHEIQRRSERKQDAGVAVPVVVPSPSPSPSTAIRSLAARLVREIHDMGGLYRGGGGGSNDSNNSGGVAPGHPHWVAWVHEQFAARAVTDFADVLVAANTKPKRRKSVSFVEGTKDNASEN